MSFLSRPWVIVGLGCLVIAALIAAAVIYYERPVTLTVAVSPADGEDFALINATAKLLHDRHASLRFRVMPTDDITASSAALDEGRANLAVVRADVAMPAKGGTVVLTHKDAGVLLAPAGGSVSKIEDLAGKRVGILSSRRGDAHILEIELGQYGVPAKDVTIVPLRLDEVGRALPHPAVGDDRFKVIIRLMSLAYSALFPGKTLPSPAPVASSSRGVDAVFAVGPITEGLVPATVKAVAEAGKGPPVFLPVAEAPAIVQRQPSYEAVEVAKGLFDGSPARPDQKFETLGVTYRLVASTDLSDHTVAALTRFMLTQRTALIRLEPSAVRMEAPSTTKGQVLPTHTGTAAYIDDKEETFLEQYSDFIYLGAMVFGVGASALTAIFTRIGASGAARVEDLVAHLVAILKLVRVAKNGAELDNLDAEVDGAVAAALEESCFRTMDERRVAALNMAVEQARSAIRDRRREFRRVLSTIESPALAFEPGE